MYTYIQLLHYCASVKYKSGLHDSVPLLRNSLIVLGNIILTILSKSYVMAVAYAKNEATASS